MRLLPILGELLLGWMVHAEIVVSGRLVDENSAGVALATVRFRLAADPPGPEVTADTGPAGNFTARLPRVGEYQVTVSHQGFFTLEAKRLEIREDLQIIQLVLNHQTEVFQSVEVREEPAAGPSDLTASTRSLSGDDLLTLPFQGRDVNNALKLMPGVVQDSSGFMHLSGSAVNQVLYTLDGFNITDPVSGTLNARLNVDTVRSLAYSSGRYSAEYGKGSAGVVAINTHMGTDAWRYNATNFVPGVDTASGLHIGLWAPRFELSGPIVKRRAWFSESISSAYSQVVAPGVSGYNMMPSLKVDNLLRGQINATPQDLLFASFLFNSTDSPRTGLSVLEPYSTTVDRRSRTWFASFKHDKTLANGALFEWGFAEDRAIQRQIPQGEDYYRITPLGKRGNYFLNSTEESNRRQFLVNYSPRAYHLFGSHQLKAGIDVDRVDYYVINHRTGIEQDDVLNRRLSLVTYAGSSVFSRPNLEASSFLVDSWKIGHGLTVESGIRQDWDELLRNVVFSPRVSISGSPFGWKNTRFAAGYAVTRDSTSLAEFSRAWDQYSVTVNYGPDGRPLSGPTYTRFRIGNRDLKTPQYHNWTVEAERQLPRRIALRVNYQRKRGMDGLTYLVVPTREPLTTNFELTNFRRDIVDSAEIMVRQTFGKQYGWMASYIRSRALSNSVISLAVDEPLWVTNNVGRMPWDAPNHLLSEGRFPTPWPSWAVLYLLEMRDGFPFTVSTDRGATVGAVNSHSYPLYFDLDVHLERRLRIGKRRVALRGGVTNVANHENPTSVNGIVGGPQYMHFYGSQGRHVVFRLRWLGTGEY